MHVFVPLLLIYRAWNLRSCSRHDAWSSSTAYSIGSRMAALRLEDFINTSPSQNLILQFSLDCYRSGQQIPSELLVPSESISFEHDADFVLVIEKEGVFRHLMVSVSRNKILGQKPRRLTFPNVLLILSSTGGFRTMGSHTVLVRFW